MPVDVEQAELGISMRVARPLALHLRTRNVDPLPVLASVGLTTRSLFAVEERVPMSVMNALWEAAAAATSDRLVGVRAALMLDFGMFEHEQQSEYIVIQLMATSATIGDAYARLARFAPLGYGSVAVDLRSRADTELVLSCRQPITPVLAEFILVCQLRSLYLLPVTPLLPRELRFAHPPPSDDVVATFAQLVGIAPHFNAPDHAVVLRTADLATPVKTSRPALVTALERRAEQEVERIAPGHSLIDRVRSLLARELEQGNPSAEHIAEQLGMSVRSVARKLASLGTSHKGLLDEVRSQAAHRLLLEVELTVDEVARILGFADASAFHRAFKRWYGMSPTELRSARTR